ncbi:hypothetical protein ERW49_06475 [Aliivibrio finisterrensis]|uniref:Uncharacterized protein n=1 Tax=Aliivibrio finisterrensis TaxID=511998 RepID=A0A4Q5KLS2_9GAMM|nr:hypothetical protein [Aliivibrio finisterrensis]RYU47361.1 hypothetical protein ERW49_06475 [Aliivibrio finisterrensis]
MSIRIYSCLLIAVCFGVNATDEKNDEFQNYVHQNVTNQSLKTVAFEAEIIWDELLSIYRDKNNKINELDARNFMVELVSIEMCLKRLQSKLKGEPSIKAEYLDTIDNSFEYVKAQNYIYQTISIDYQDTIISLLPKQTCGDHLTQDEIENITSV